MLHNIHSLLYRSINNYDKVLNTGFNNKKIMHY